MIKKNPLFMLAMSLSVTLLAQTTTLERPIRTATVFLRTVPDARSGGIGDIGVVSTADAYSQFHNASKYLFSEEEAGIAVSYTPWLNNLVNDIFLGHVVYHQKVGEGQLGASLYYFNLGKINLYEGYTSGALASGTYRPTELSVDVSYSLKLSEAFGMGTALRYIYSDLTRGTNNSLKSGQSVAIDLSGYYQPNYEAAGSYQDRFRLGFQLSNIGPKMRYSNTGTDTGVFLPTKLSLGGAYDMKFSSDELSFMMQLSKLLVPASVETYDSTGKFAGYKDPDDSVLGGLFSSFSSDLLREFTYSLGAEYRYEKMFAFRLGYLYEDPKKGYRNFISTGIGFHYQDITFDFSTLFSMNNETRDPLQNTLRFSLGYQF